MILYNQYEREDGVKCSAVQYKSSAYDAYGPDHLFEILEILNAAELKAYWVDKEETDQIAVDDDGMPILDENDELVMLVIPEHIVIEASKDKLQKNDYIVMRDGETYIQDGRTFEAVWTIRDSTLTDLGEFLQSRKEIEQ